MNFTISEIDIRVAWKTLITNFQLYEVSAQIAETKTPVPELASQIELPKNSGEIQKVGRILIFHNAFLFLFGRHIHELFP